MKLMVASDIHGAAGYCEELLKRFEEEGADRLILLGDILYHGPRNDLPDEYNPKKVIEMLNPLADKLMCVRGNCDTEVDQMVLEFPILADYAIIYVGNRMIYATHGHHINPNDTGNLKTGDILLSGHTHIPMCEERNGILCLNPGSVSIPKENSKHSYMIIDDNNMVWKNLNGEEYMQHYL
ncbi:MAG: phosphodiesterase [Lachnospiraceae bacterium]|nr:phosphodiesterase [Lachnospiraceae bacterium]